MVKVASLPVNSGGLSFFVSKTFNRQNCDDILARMSEMAGDSIVLSRVGLL